MADPLWIVAVIWVGASILVAGYITRRLRPAPPKRHQWPTEAAIAPQYLIVVGDDIVVTTNSASRAHAMVDRINDRLRGYEGAATVEELRAVALGEGS